MKKRLILQISTLLFLVIAGAGYNAFMVYNDAEPSRAAGYLWNATFAFLVTCWIEDDRKAKCISAPFEYGAFVFFLWPVLAPYYLAKTRGWRGLSCGVGLILLSITPNLVGLLTYYCADGGG